MPRPNSNRPVYYDEGGSGQSSAQVHPQTPNQQTTSGFGQQMLNNQVTTGRNNTAPTYNAVLTNTTNTTKRSNNGVNTTGASNGTKSTSTDTTTESIWEKWLSQLKESQDELLAALKAANEQGQSDLAYRQKLGREQNNRWLMTANRQIGNMYGGENSGAKLYAMSRNQSNWLGRQGDTNRDYLSNLSKLNTDYANNVANAKSNYANQLFNAWNTKYGYDTDLNYKKYLMDHGYLG